MNSNAAPAGRRIAETTNGGRPLRRYAGVWALWGLAVSAVIPGEYSGWNTGLLEGGFGGLLIATLLVIVMYLCLCYSLGEMAAAMPFTGGGYAFGRSAFGPIGGFLAGLAQNIAYVLTAAAVVVSAGHALDKLVIILSGWDAPDILYWALVYGVFVFINIYGVALTFRLAVGLTVVTLLVLAAFALVAIPNFRIAYALDIAVAPGGSRWLPNGLSGIALSVPFAIWFLVLVEMLTLATEETENPETNVPKGLIASVWTLIVAALIVLVLNSGIPPGASAIGKAPEPLLTGFSAILGRFYNPAVLELMTLLAYAAGFHATVYAFGRSIFAFARAGYFPLWLAATHPTRKTPHAALIAGGVVGFGAVCLVKFSPRALEIEAVLLNMAVFAATISYIIMMLSYLKLRRDMPDMKRPYVSPLGATGAMTALVVAIVAAFMMFHNPSYRPGLLGCAAVYALGVIYFLLYGRKKIVTSPEERFAMELRGETTHD